MKIIKLVLTSVTLVTLSTNAFSICRYNDISGRWDGVVVAANGAPEKCQFNFSNSGTLTGGYCLLPNGSRIDASGGTISIAPDCTVSASVTYNNGVFAVLNGNMGRSKDTMVGVFANNVNLYGTFTAVRY